MDKAIPEKSRKSGKRHNISGKARKSGKRLKILGKPENPEKEINTGKARNSAAKMKLQKKTDIKNYTKNPRKGIMYA